MIVALVFAIIAFLFETLARGNSRAESWPRRQLQSSQIVSLADVLESDIIEGGGVPPPLELARVGDKKIISTNAPGALEMSILSSPEDFSMILSDATPSRITPLSFEIAKSVLSGGKRVLMIDAVEAKDDYRLPIIMAAAAKWKRDNLPDAVVSLIDAAAFYDIGSPLPTFATPFRIFMEPARPPSIYTKYGFEPVLRLLPNYSIDDYEKDLAKVRTFAANVLSELLSPGIDIYKPTLAETLSIFPPAVGEEMALYIQRVKRLGGSVRFLNSMRWISVIENSEQKIAKISAHGLDFIRPLLRIIKVNTRLIASDISA